MPDDGLLEPVDQPASVTHPVRHREATVDDGPVHFDKAQSGGPLSRWLAITFAGPESRGVPTPGRIAPG